MVINSGSRKRIFLNKFDTYEKAVAAKNTETRYPQEQLQIKKRDNGKSFDLLARISIKSSKETI